MKDDKEKIKEAKEILRKGTYCGYSGESEFLSYSWENFLAHCRGEILVGIGKGEFDYAVTCCLRYAMAYEAYYAKKLELQAKFNIEF